MPGRRPIKRGGPTGTGPARRTGLRGSRWLCSVDGALPSDMALGDPGGLAEEHRLFYVAITRARDHLYLYAPQRLHYHRRGRDDRYGFGQLTRFLDAEALGACDSVTASPPAPLLPAVGSLATRVDAALGSLWDG